MKSLACCLLSSAVAFLLMPWWKGGTFYLFAHTYFSFVSIPVVLLPARRPETKSSMQPHCATPTRVQPHLWISTLQNLRIQTPHRSPKAPFTQDAYAKAELLTFPFGRCRVWILSPTKGSHGCTIIDFCPPSWSSIDPHRLSRPPIPQPQILENWGLRLPACNWQVWGMRILHKDSFRFCEGTGVELGQTEGEETTAERLRSASFSSYLFQLTTDAQSVFASFSFHVWALWIVFFISSAWLFASCRRWHVSRILSTLVIFYLSTFMNFVDHFVLKFVSLVSFPTGCAWQFYTFGSGSTTPTAVNVSSSFTEAVAATATGSSPKFSARNLAARTDRVQVAPWT